MTTLRDTIARSIHTMYEGYMDAIGRLADEREWFYRAADAVLAELGGIHETTLVGEWDLQDAAPEKWIGERVGVFLLPESEAREAGTDWQPPGREHPDQERTEAFGEEA